MGIEVRNIVKRFGEFTALAGFDLNVSDGEFVALLGPSGSGKTTLLRVIAGLDWADSGTVLFNGVDASPRHVRERSVGFVFQHYALFRHMTVFENVAFGFRVKPRRTRPSESEIRERVTALLRLVQIEHFSDRYPSQLSGGQRQRVALARALAIEPRVLLLDEPFGALDAKVRKELRRWLRELHDRMKLTSVFVTHDQEEALELADRVVVMNRGGIEQEGTPEEIYDNPKSMFVYEFLGNANRVFCTIRGGRAEVWGGWFDVADPGTDGEAPGVAYVRPHDIDIAITAGRPGRLAVVRHVSTAGPAAAIDLLVAGEVEAVEAHLPRERQRELRLSPGQEVLVMARKARVFLRPSQNL
ncbi:MAG: sulfate ABC transporter ATP-binding protein [Alphaproteobacteria bacterium]